MFVKAILVCCIFGPYDPPIIIYCCRCGCSLNIGYFWGYSQHTFCLHHEFIVYDLDTLMRRVPERVHELILELVQTLNCAVSKIIVVSKTSIKQYLKAHVWQSCGRNGISIIFNVSTLQKYFGSCCST